MAELKPMAPSDGPLTDERFKGVLAEYNQRLVVEDETIANLEAGDFWGRRDEFLLPVGPDTGAMLNALAKGLEAQTILEIGTSYGYSTLWFGEAARATGGKVISLELSPVKAEYARAALARAGLEGHVEVVVGDACETLRGLPGPFDLVLLDLWKELYIPCFDLFLDKLGAGAVVVADNIIWPSNTRVHAEAYRAHVRASGLFDSVLLPLGSGLEISRRHAG
jgi:predicted O-methyltransferase YrrM